VRDRERWGGAGRSGSSSRTSCRFSRQLRLACGVALAALCSPLAGYASDIDAAPAVSCAQVGSPTAVSQDPKAPPNASGPTRVGASIHVLELREIDPIQGSYVLRGYLRASWCDPRQAFDRAAEGADERIYIAAAANEVLERIWTLGGFPVNQVDEVRITERILRIRFDGTIEQDANLVVRLAARFDLRRFPFDEQILKLEIESFAHSSLRVQLVSDARRTGFDPAFQLPEWEIAAATGSVSQVSVVRSSEPFSRYTLRITIARKPGFYLWKVLLPLIIIVALSWSVFWMPDEKFATRSRITATGVLTVVAYQFGFGADLPRIGYLTLLDKTMIFSFGLLAISMLESLLISPMQSAAPERALRIDKLSRALFPLVYGIGLALIFGVGA